MLLNRTRRELLATTTRQDLLELMAFDDLYGLPDVSDRKLPAAPKYHKAISAEEAAAKFARAFG